MGLKEIREEYPEYNDWSDEELSKGLYKKFYNKEQTYDEFTRDIGEPHLSNPHEDRMLSIGTPDEVKHAKFDETPVGETEYDDLINKYSEQYGLPSDLVKRQIRAESGFDPNARPIDKKTGKYLSSAKGLMQLLDGTARDLGVTNPYDPEQSIEGGTRYLSQLHDQWPDYNLALAAYHDGPTAVNDVLAGKKRFSKAAINYVKQITGTDLEKYDPTLAYKYAEEEVREERKEIERVTWENPRKITQEKRDLVKGLYEEPKEATKEALKGIGVGILSAQFRTQDLDKLRAINNNPVAMQAYWENLSPVDQQEFYSYLDKVEAKNDRRFNKQEFDNLRLAWMQKRNIDNNKDVQKAIVEIQKLMKADPNYVRREGFLWDVWRMGPQLGIQILAGIATGPIGAGLSMASMIAGQSYIEAIEKGVSPERAAKAAWANAAVQGIMEGFAFGKLTKFWRYKNGLNGKIRKLAESTMTDFVTETMQAYPEYLTHYWATNPDEGVLKAFGATLDNAWKIIQKGAYEGLVASVLPFMGGAIKIGKDIYVDRRKLKHAKNEMIEEVNASDMDDEAKKTVIEQIRNAKFKDINKIDNEIIDQKIEEGPQPESAEDETRVEIDKYKKMLEEEGESEVVKEEKPKEPTPKEKIKAQQIKEKPHTVSKIKELKDEREVKTIVDVYEERGEENLNQHERARLKAARERLDVLQKTKDEDKKPVKKVEKKLELTNKEYEEAASDLNNSLFKKQMGQLEVKYVGKGKYQLYNNGVLVNKKATSLRSMRAMVDELTSNVKTPDKQKGVIENKYEPSKMSGDTTSGRQVAGISVSDYIEVTDEHGNTTLQDVHDVKDKTHFQYYGNFRTKKPPVIVRLEQKVNDPNWKWHWLFKKMREKGFNTRIAVSTNAQHPKFLSGQRVGAAGGAQDVFAATEMVSVIALEGNKLQENGDKVAEETLAHEGVHILLRHTIGALDTKKAQRYLKDLIGVWDSIGEEDKAKLKKLRDDNYGHIRYLYDSLESASKRKEHPYENIAAEELVTLLTTNKSVYDTLSKIKVKGVKPPNNTLWHKLIDVITKLVVGDDVTAADAVIEVLERHIGDNPFVKELTGKQPKAKTEVKKKAATAKKKKKLSSEEQKKIIESFRKKFPKEENISTMVDDEGMDPADAADAYEEYIKMETGDLISGTLPNAFKDTNILVAPGKKHKDGVGHVFMRRDIYEDSGNATKIATTKDEMIANETLDNIDRLERELYKGTWEFQKFFDMVAKRTPGLKIYISRPSDPHWHGGSGKKLESALSGVARPKYGEGHKLTSQMIFLNPVAIGKTHYLGDKNVDYVFLHELIHTALRQSLDNVIWGEKSEKFVTSLSQMIGRIPDGELTEFANLVMIYENRHKGGPTEDYWNAMSPEEQHRAQMWQRIFFYKETLKNDLKNHEWEEVFNAIMGNGLVLGDFYTIASVMKDGKKPADNSLGRQFVRSILENYIEGPEIDYLLSKQDRSVADDIVGLFDEYIGSFNGDHVLYRDGIDKASAIAPVDFYSLDLRVYKGHPKLHKDAKVLMPAIKEKGSGNIWWDNAHFLIQDADGNPRIGIEGFVQLNDKGRMVGEFFNREEAGAIVDPNQNIIDPDSKTLASEDMIQIDLANRENPTSGMEPPKKEDVKRVSKDVIRRRKTLSPADMAVIEARLKERGGKSPREAWAEARKTNQQRYSEAKRKIIGDRIGRWALARPTDGLSNMTETALEKERDRVQSILDKDISNEDKETYYRQRLTGIDIMLRGYARKRVADQKKRQEERAKKAGKTTLSRIRFYKAEYKRAIRLDFPVSDVNHIKGKLVSLMGPDEFYKWSGEETPVVKGSVAKKSEVPKEQIAEVKEEQGKKITVLKPFTEKDAEKKASVVPGAKSKQEARNKYEAVMRGVNDFIASRQTLNDEQVDMISNAVQQAKFAGVLDEGEFDQAMRLISQAAFGIDSSVDADEFNTSGLEIPDSPSQRKLDRWFGKGKIKFDAYHSPADGFIPSGYMFTVYDESSPLFKGTFSVTEFNKKTIQNKINEMQDYYAEVKIKTQGTVEPRKHKYAKPDMEAKARAAERGIKDASWFQKSWETITDALRQVREFPHLRRKEAPDVQYELRQLKKAKANSARRAIKILQTVLSKLDRTRYHNLQRLAYLMDLREQVFINDELRAKGKEEDIKVTANPFGWSDNDIKREAQAAWEIVMEDQRTKHAWEVRKLAWFEIRKIYKDAMKNVGFDVANRLHRAHYFRHQVLDFMQGEHNRARQAGFTTSPKLAVPTRRSHLRVRGAETGYAMNLNFLQAEFEIMTQLMYDSQVAITLDEIMTRYGSKEYKEGYELYKPREDAVFYMAHTIPEKLLRDALEAGSKEISVPRKKVKQALALGGKYTGYYLPSNIAATLNTALAEKPANGIMKIFKTLLTAWKAYQLLMPLRAFKYNARNMTGDAEAVFLGSPGVFKFAPRAFADILNWKLKGKISDRLQEWIDRGGQETTLQAQEMFRIVTRPEFRELTGERLRATQIPKAVAQKLWGILRGLTDAREMLLRYAAYVKFAKEIENNNGKPKRYVASLREEVDALVDNKDKAFMMSNDLLGAYDRISEAGEGLRKYIYPFWSFQEVNMKRTYTMFKNIANDDGVMMAIGKSFGVKAPFLAIKAGKFAFKFFLFSVAVQLWNNWKFPEEEDALPEEMRRRSHIILGRTTGEKPEIYYFPRIGVVGDLLEWIGMDTAPADVVDLIHGKESFKSILKKYDYGKENVKDIVNKVVQGVGPQFKMPFEAVMGEKFFPSVWNRQPITDFGKYVADNAVLGSVYDAISGRPTRNDWASREAIRTGIYYEDKYRLGWLAVQQKLNDYKRRTGLKGRGFIVTESGSALYNVGMAWRYGDQKALSKYLAKYVEATVKKYGKVDLTKIMHSEWEKLNPLESLPDTHKKLFLMELLSNERDAYAFGLALRYYAEIKSGKQFLKRHGKNRQKNK